VSLGAALGRLERDLGDLLARHERGRDLTEFERYEHDPVGFIQEVLGDREETQVKLKML